MTIFEALAKRKTLRALKINYLQGFVVPGDGDGTPVYITAEELRQIADFDFSSRPALAVQRDIFVFQCCVGCRIGDLYRMTWSNVEGDVFDYIEARRRMIIPRPYLCLLSQWQRRF